MSQKPTKFCSNCGAEIDIRAEICPKCGVRQTSTVERVSNAWFLVPFFLLLINGVVAWLATRERDSKKAGYFLVFGLVWTVVVIILVVAFFFMFFL